jgi:hypothetical protein
MEFIQSGEKRGEGLDAATAISADATVAWTDSRSGKSKMSISFPKR